PKTAALILRSLEFKKRNVNLVRFPVAAIEANLLRQSVEKHPGVTRARVAGSVRRCNEVAGDIDIAAECTGDPVKIADSYARSPGVKSVSRSSDGRSAMIEFVDGTRFDIHCAVESEFPITLW